MSNSLRKRTLPLVLCHADIHAGNQMIDNADRLWVVDWDQTMLAPKDRDLMFVVGAAVLGPIGDENETAFLQGYGDCELDTEALAYYRYAWAVQDIATFVEDIFERPDLGEAAKAQTLRYFKSLFEPGMIVEAALRST